MMPEAAPRPDLLVLGDSHTICLREGAARLGLVADGLSYSGNHWHEARFRHGREGFQPRTGGWPVRQIEALRARLGARDPFGLGLPLLTTAGFHLGRLAGLLEGAGLRPAAMPEADFAGSGHRAQDFPGALSQDFLADYIFALRRPHFVLLERLAAKGPVVVLAPPRIVRMPVRDWIGGMIAAHLRARGLTVIDPAALLHGPGACLPPSEVTPDGLHATAACGAALLRALAAAGHLGEALGARLAASPGAAPAAPVSAAPGG